MHFLDIATMKLLLGQALMQATHMRVVMRDDKVHSGTRGSLCFRSL